MAAANSRLYLATKDGRILCFAGNSPHEIRTNISRGK
jgi:hypothetical protein